MKIGDKFYLYDIETMIDYEVSEEEYHNYNNMIKSLRGLLDCKIEGTIYITGISGEINNNVKELFMNPNKEYFTPRYKN
jgi:hypothetical protein